MDARLDQEAMEVIDRAEKEIAALAAKAAANLDYALAPTLLALAQRIREAARPLAAASAPKAADVEVHVAAQSPPTPKPTLSQGKAGNTAYPHFKKEGDNLVKVGWSKSDRTTYEHRSPRSVLDRLVDRIKQAGATGNRFTTEDVMPLHDDTGTELPSYQAYLCLAWLVAINLLQKHGRQGYTINSDDLDSATESAWSELPAR